ncbi:unnamed protein product [Withania somnifera]
MMERKYTKKQLKNGWNCTKSEWTIFKQLIRGEMGLGWDATKNTIMADDNWWEQKIKEDVRYKKFRKADLSLLWFRYDALFFYIVATGARARSVNQEEASGIGVDLDEDEINDIDDRDKEHFINLNDEGTLDGTHVKARLPQGQEIPYIGRKGVAHDSHIFGEALGKRELNFPHPLGNKYYLVKIGYSHMKGYMAPYKGNKVRYHLSDFRRGATRQLREPRGPTEKFNYLHSSCRNVVERSFGV